MKGPGQRSQSETLGVVLLLGLTILSVGALAAFGGTAIHRTQHSVDVQSAEHALSQFDSEASLVALGRSDRQSVSLGRGRKGTFTVLPDRGRVVITHENATNNGTATQIYDATLGEVRYESGDTVIAYQGGGVWRSQGGNGSVMVSAPEFHYRDATLTFPVIRLDGQGSVAGSATATIVGSGPSLPVFPNGNALTNPVHNGTIRVTITSEFYRGWAAYFRSRTDGNVTVYDSNRTVVLDLISSGVKGNFAMPLDGSPLKLRGMSPNDPVGSLRFRLYSDQPTSQQFNGFAWSLWTKQGSKEFEIRVGKGNENCGGPVPVAVYYFNGTEEQGWYNASAFSVTCPAGGRPYVDVNLTSDMNVSYTDLSTSQLTKFHANNDFADPVTLTYASGPVTYSTNSDTSLANVTNYYIGLFSPNVDLTVMDGQSNGAGKSSGNVNEQISSGFADINGSGRSVTYLYVSNNTVNVSLS